MPLNAGFQLGPYEIVSPLGAGAMGEVYRAKDSRLAREVAIKVLPDHLARNPEALSRFEREAKALAALSHPNILAIHDFTQDRELYFAVMELLQGETLRERIHASSLSWKRALEIGIAIAEGLSAAHSRGVIHRDLKPENIFLTTDGQVKILDFGLARTKEMLPSTGRSKDTQPGTVLGTVDYMSPEQVRGEETDERSDIFSFGCVLYEMLTGKCVFSRHDLAETLIAILKEEPPGLLEAGVPFELERLAMHCLEKNPDQRFQSARDLAFDLRAIWHDSGIIRTAPVPTVKPGLKRKLGIVALVLFVFGLAGLTYILVRARGSAIDSLAVLPFASESSNSEMDYLTDGITESIISNLSRLPKLRVMARSTVFRYKGKDADPQETGKKLKVNAVLTGRVFQQQDHLIIKAELVRVEDGAQLWGEQYNRRVSDLFQLEQEISREITENLKLRLSGDEKKLLAKNYTQNNEAYQNYLKGRYFWNKRTDEGLNKAIDYFERAIDSDPNYALAYAGLADCYNLLTDYTGVPPRDTFPKAIAAARKALEIDEGVAEAHISLAHAVLSYDWNWGAAEKEYERGIQLSPNYATGHHWLGWYWAMRGMHERSLSQIKQAQQLDPLSMIINANVGLFYYFARQHDDAIEQCRKTLEMDPKISFVRYYLGMAYEQKGELNQALAEFEKASSLSTYNPGVLSSVGRVYALRGEKEKAKEVENRLTQMAKDRYISPCLIARIPIALGEKDRAFDLLNEAHLQKDELLLWLKVDPRFDSLRGDSRFQSLIQKIGFP